MGQCREENVSKKDKGEGSVRIKSGLGKDKRELKGKLIAEGGRKSREVEKSILKVTMYTAMRFPKVTIEVSDYSPQIHENENRMSRVGGYIVNKCQGDE